MSDDLTFDSSRPTARSDALIRDIDGGFVAWSPIASEPVHLAPLSAAVFQLLDGEVSAGELVADLCSVLEVDVAVARDVLRRQLSDLDSAGLLVTSSPTAKTINGGDVFPAPPNP